MLIHDYIKTLYINLGYLPNNAVHLTSDEEMFDAFLREDGVFADYYPCPDITFESAYDELLAYITDKIDDHLNNGTDLLSWIYSYMMLVPVTFDSSDLDILDLGKLLGIETAGQCEFDVEYAEACYAVSTRWLNRASAKHEDRPPTMFGENHVIKCLRLEESSVNLGS